uniref:Uncharacterized protein n=1 Tax=Mycena chlorophos TaxID=658473 RepID=A0ABQ0LAY1_MYCCL|nr:predicted protein [Mycena chlorophos]
MGRAAHYHTQEARAAARAQQKAAWEKTEGGRFIRKQQRQASSRRHTVTTHIPRLPPLPSKLYTWLKCPGSLNYSKEPEFRKALHDDYDETPIAHWLEDPPFEVPDEYQPTGVGPTYHAQTKKLVHAVHARHMPAVQAREATRRQLEGQLGPFYAMNAWRNQAQHLLYRWHGCLRRAAEYDVTVQPREHAMWLVHMHWLSVELDRLFHLKFLKSS